MSLSTFTPVAWDGLRFWTWTAAFIPVAWDGLPLNPLTRTFIPVAWDGLARNLAVAVKEGVFYPRCVGWLHVHQLANFYPCCVGWLIALYLYCVGWLRDR